MAKIDHRKIRDTIQTASLIVQLVRAVINIFRRRKNRVCPRTGRRIAAIEAEESARYV